MSDTEKQSWTLQVEEPDYLDGIKSGLIVRSGDGRPVAYMFDAADARLSAAAPDMYEALKDFVSEYDGFEDGDGNPCPVLAKAEAALSKAEGTGQ